MSNQQPVYQVSRLTPGVIEVIVQDDSPDVVAQKFFQFFGVDLPIAYLHEYDFNNVLTFVDKSFQNIIHQYPIEQWNSIAIRQSERKQVYLGKRCLGCQVITQDQEEKDCLNCEKIVEDRHDNCGFCSGGEKQKDCESCKEYDIYRENEVKKGFEDLFQEQIIVKKEWDIVQLCFLQG